MINTRIIVLLLLVLMFMAHTVTALDPIVLSANIPAGLVSGESLYKSNSWNSTASYYNAEGYVYTYFSANTVEPFLSNFPSSQRFVRVGSTYGNQYGNADGLTYKEYIQPFTLPAEASLLTAFAQTVNYAGGPGSPFPINITVIKGSVSAIYVFSGTNTYTASGESCDREGAFSIYIDNNYSFIDNEDGNYSFTIIENVNYSIHFTNSNISEWHNFTASDDETWNPPNTCNNADFNFTNLSYTSPVKQYLTSTVTVDINDTDGTISSAIARIDGSNYSMQFIGGEKWRYLFTGTNIIKNYYITNIYATDNDGGQDSVSYNSSYIHVESRTGGGGGGGGGSYPPDPTIPPSEPCTLNCDTDGDGTCDLNCDDNDDGTCDRNCDTDDDGTCDLNCDTDDDGTCDLNCDDNNDGTCDRNCDTDGDGYCDVNCDDSANRPRDEDIPDDFKDLFENFRDGDIPDDFWTDKNLRIHPASLNSTAFYTGWDKPQNVTYRFLTNKFIDSCEVTNGTCTIDQRFLVNFNTIIIENTTGYRGTLTVSRTGETAIADIYINVINLCACKEITPWQLNISDEWAQKLVYFVRVKDGAIVCIRWWAMIALLIILLGIVLYDSNKR